MAINTTMIKELRQASGAGVLDCKKALEATEGDFGRALEHLREKGLDAAAKKASRQANEGLVTVLVDAQARAGAIVEVNCETDFVARTDDFRRFVHALARQVAQHPNVSSVPEMLKQPFIEDQSKAIGEHITQLVATLGENILLRRFERIERSKTGLIEGYVHPGSRIGVLVYISVGSAGLAESPAFVELVHDLALQIAASAPLFIDTGDIPKATIEAERDKYRAQLAEEKKPDHIKERILTGKLDKWYAEVCLLRQPFVKELSISIDDLLAQKSQELGAALTVEHFVRYELGLGD